MKKDGISKSFDISKYKFDKKTIESIEDNIWFTNFWPIVYILSDEKLGEAYVGESATAISRMKSHLLNPERNKLGCLHLVTSSEFNKSATLDIESNLLQYISSDGRYKLLNGNLGLVFHNYYQKAEYFELFVEIWNKLKYENVAFKSLKEIDNSDLFKYSPYKSLSTDQYNSINEIINILLNNGTDTIFVEGAAGTGKTILAIFLIKLLVTDFNGLFERDEVEMVDEKLIIAGLKQKYPSPKVALVVPMVSLRNTLKTVFKNIKGLSAKMVIGPSEVAKNKYDILIVDEAHRLRRRKGITNYKSFDDNNKLLNLGDSGTELDWVLMQSDKHIFFYDSAQSIKPSDIQKIKFDAILKKSKRLKLQSQLRVKGGPDYITYIDKLLNSKLLSAELLFDNKDYEFILFDSLETLITRLNKQEQEFGLCRLVSGYSWEWKSKKNKNTHDIEIDGIKLKWNTEFHEWINSNNAANEVGCIHTTQGYDLNFTGVIFGEEISYDPETNEVIIIEGNYYDSKGKVGIKDPEELKAFIINIYKTLMYRGIRGTYVYVCDKNLKAYFKKHIRSFEKDAIIRKLSINDFKLNKNCVPYYDISAAAGEFSTLQHGLEKKWIELSRPYRAKEDYFVCKVVGESMNKKIPNGSLCVFQNDPGGSREGKIVLAQHYKFQDSDFGSGYTVKLYHSEKEANQESWSHKAIILKPLSYDSSYKDIILVREEISELKVVGIFICVIE